MATDRLVVEKRRYELLVLAYTPLWMGVVAWVLFSRAFVHWGDVGHMILGVGLALPLWILPFALRGRMQLHAWRFSWAIAVMTFLQSFFGTIYFFETLGMSYHFPVTITLNRTPVFLYFMTIPYFSTYYVLLSLMWRYVGRGSKARQLVLQLALSVAIAFGEMFFMVNDRLRDFYTYRDNRYALTWGSFFYSAVFFFSLRVFAALDEDEIGKPTWRELTGQLLAANMLILIAYAALSLMMPSP